MSAPCTCKLDAKPLLSLKRYVDPSISVKSSGSKPGVFSIVNVGELVSGGTSGCKVKGPDGAGGAFGALGAGIANSLLGGIWPEAPTVDTSELDEIQAMNDTLKESLNDCKHEMTNCKIDQTKDLFTQQIELTKALQKVVDIAQDAKLEKNVSMTYFAIGFVVIMFVYLMALPVYRPPQPVF